MWLIKTTRHRQEHTDMKSNERHIKSVIKAAKECDTVLPWSRGARRDAFIAKRNSKALLKKSA
ncbi:hypothetical protein E4Z66_12885 [Aliishimia ponticola]|uniref:Uncharacterized protein n=1 Tax=Aliishimia ponticola TaxID=2499833 RepID=A0A4S4NBW5_9RHOB|nr:hypothetical protein E4Z66_12885 [Aliishimia ponticola]